MKEEETEKLELKHLAPYLSYGLQCQIDFKFTKYHPIPIIKVKGLSNAEIDKDIEEQIELVRDDDLDFRKLDSVKPILRPLSDLTKEIEHNCKKFVPVKELEARTNTNDEYFEWDDTEALMKWITYDAMVLLFEWHFDVFELIPKGLAVDKNTLNQ